MFRPPELRRTGNINGIPLYQFLMDKDPVDKISFKGIIILNCLANVEDDGKTEHVSVSLTKATGEPFLRTPTWEEMCYVKDQFWGDEDVVVQFHPKKSEYVNVHSYVLHLWRNPSWKFE